MKLKKRPIEPINDQNWFEKAVDCLAQEERFQPLMAFFVGAMLLQFLAIWFTANVLERPVLADGLVALWRWTVLPLAAVPMFNAFCGLWNLVDGKKLQGPICEEISRRGGCTYLELVTACRPIKIHLGIDLALEKLLRTQQITVDCCPDGTRRYRIPTEEEKRQREVEWVEANGTKITYEDLAFVFGVALGTYDSVTVEFALGEELGHSVGKLKGGETENEVFWCAADDGSQSEFSTFEDLTAAPLFHGHSLREVWDQALVMEIDGYDALDWLRLHGHTSKP